MIKRINDKISKLLYKNVRNILRFSYERIVSQVTDLDNELLSINTKNISKEDRDKILSEYEYLKEMREHLGMSIAFLTNLYDKKIIDYNEEKEQFYLKSKEEI